MLRYFRGLHFPRTIWYDGVIVEQYFHSGLMKSFYISSRNPADVTNADWEQGIYKDRLVPKPDLPIIGDEASSTSASYAGADDDDDDAGAGAGAKVRKYSLDYFCGHIITHLLPHMTNNYPTHMNKASGEGRGQGRASAIDVDL